MTTDDSAPSGLHELEYARHILEEVLGWPAKTNLELMGDCLRSIAKSRKLTLVKAHGYMVRAIRLAKEQCIPVDRYFFMEGKYTDMRPEKESTRFPVFDREALAREREALAREQATEEWQELNAQLRAALAKIAHGTEMPERKKANRVTR